MEKLTKKQLLSAFLIALSTTSVFADYGDRDHRDNDYRNDRRSGRRAVDTHERDRRRTRYESRFAKIDICEEIKEDLYNAEDEFYNFESNLRSQDQVISSKRSIISNRQRALSSKQASFNQLNREVSRLTDLSRQKPRLLKQERENLQQATAEKPLAVATLEDAKDKRDQACKGFFTGTLTSRKCRRATSARDDAQSALNAIQSRIDSAKSQVEMLQRVDSDLAQATKSLAIAEQALTIEQGLTPSISQLESDVRSLESSRRDTAVRFNEVESNLARIEFRVDKCERMQFEAKKSKVFHDYISIFAANNGAGCNESHQTRRRSRDRVQEEGINQAYRLVCESDLLVREINTCAP